MINKIFIINHFRTDEVTENKNSFIFKCGYCNIEIQKEENSLLVICTSKLYPNEEWVERFNCTDEMLQFFETNDYQYLRHSDNNIENALNYLKDLDLETVDKEHIAVLMIKYADMFY